MEEFTIETHYEDVVKLEEVGGFYNSPVSSACGSLGMNEGDIACAVSVALNSIYQILRQEAGTSQTVPITFALTSFTIIDNFNVQANVNITIHERSTTHSFGNSNALGRYAKFRRWNGTDELYLLGPTWDDSGNLCITSTKAKPSAYGCSYGHNCSSGFSVG
jgi:hypothetical protein